MDRGSFFSLALLCGDGRLNALGMRRVRPCRCVGALLVLALLYCTCWPAYAAKEKKPKNALPTTQWAEGQPGCTFSRGSDGKYSWGLWTEDFGIVVALDSQELQLSKKRLQPMLGVLVTVRYRGTTWLDVRNDNLTLEFLDHFNVIKSSLDPDALSTSLQNGADELEDEMDREVRKHREVSDKQKMRLEAYQNDVSAMQEFLATHSLRPVRLDAANPETSGWVFFGTRNKWIGDWKKQEHFLLRIPMENRVYEFPVTLPPIQGDLILRRRAE